jgi:hypothetical protein
MYKFSVLLIFAATLAAQAPSAGLAPGAAIPAFSLPDQNGRPRSFNDIRGPKGAMLVFYRSADW